MTNAIARLTEQLIGSLRYWVHHLHLDLDRFARDDWVPWHPLDEIWESTPVWNDGDPVWSLECSG